MQKAGLPARNPKFPSHFNHSTEADSPSYRRGFKGSQWTPSPSLLSWKYTMHFSASARWRAHCVVRVLLLGGWHFGTHDQKSSSSYSCQGCTHCTHHGTILCWVRSPELPEKAKLVEKQLLFSSFKSKISTSHHCSLCTED